MIQPTDHKKFSMKEGPSEDASNPLRSGKQNNHGRQREGGTWPGRAGGEGGEIGSRIRNGGRQE